MRYVDELQWFFDICITRDRNHRILSCQDNYINKLIVKFNINTLIKSLKASFNFYKQIEKNLNQTITQ